jgi:hypothetical protein
MTHKTLEEIKNLTPGTYKVGVYSSFGCIGCENYVALNQGAVDYFVDLHKETNIDFKVYTFLPPFIPSIITITK